MNFTLQETLEVQVFFHLLVLRSMKTLSSYQRKIAEKTRAKYGFKFQSCLLCQQQLYKKKNKQKDLALLQKITTKNGSTKKDYFILRCFKRDSHKEIGVANKS